MQPGAWQPLSSKLLVSVRVAISHQVVFTHIILLHSLNVATCGVPEQSLFRVHLIDYNLNAKICGPACRYNRCPLRSYLAFDLA